MHCLCTSCCRDKRLDARPLAAIDRYLSPRIAFVASQCRRLGMPLRILSGRFGLLAPEEEIPWYDQALTSEAVTELQPRVSRQLAEGAITAMTFYCRPRDTPGWQPYFEVLENACAETGTPLGYLVSTT